MKNEHAISDEVLNNIQSAINRNENWIAYNNSIYFIDKRDVFFFKTENEAKEFAINNISDFDQFNVFYANSIADVFRQMPYGENMFDLFHIHPDANPLYNKEGNDFTDHLIDHIEKNQLLNNLKTKIMDEKTLAFNEGQLKRVGFAEAFTPELKKKMEEGHAVIQHSFQKNYENDEVRATLYLKKSPTSDYYFLNKFDLELQKEAVASNIKQTFYLTKKISGDENEQGGQKSKLENKYTLKEAYNLLDGRPVFKNLVNNEGKEYQAWVKLNFKNKLDNGNYEMKQYTANYGFNLDDVLRKYPIKELMNPEYKQALIDSLHRGNLQKVTFVGGDGKEEKLLVSPHITFGALNAYDLNKQRLTTDMLVEKQLIGKELAESLKERVSQIQKNSQSQKQEPPTNSVKQKQGQSQKQSGDQPVKKQTRKQNVH